MNKIRNQGVINRIADRTRKAGKSRNIIAVLAIALTTILFTTLFTVGGSIIKKQQESTMRQVGGSAHAGFKYLTEQEYDIVKKDDKLKEVSYRIVVAEALNKELVRTGVALDAVLERYGVSSIGEMDAGTYKKAMNSLKRTKTKAA